MSQNAMCCGIPKSCNQIKRYQVSRKLMPWDIQNQAISYHSELLTYTVQCRYNAVNFLINIHKSHPIARPWLWSFFVNPASDWYSASVPVIIYVIFYNIRQHYNITRLYNEIISWPPCQKFHKDKKLINLGELRQQKLTGNNLRVINQTSFSMYLKWKSSWIN